MRILLITDNYLPHRGGSRIYYHETLTRLAARHEVRVLTCRHPQAASFDASTPYDIRRIRLREASWLRRMRLQQLPVYIALLLSSLRHALTFRPDAVMAGELVPTGAVASHIARLLHIPLVLFTHAEGPATIARTRFQSRLAYKACLRAALIVAASENARRSLMDDLGIGAGKIEVIVPGVADRHLDPQYQAHPLQENAPPRLLSVGRLVRRKGFIPLLQALDIARRSLPALRLAIVGAGPLKPVIEATIEQLGLGDIVRLAGEIDDQELLRLYAQADCFVLPNSDDPTTGDTEGFVIAFGEAAAHGLPVIAGRDGGTAHSVLHERTGLRIDGSDPEAICQAILRILTDPNLAREMGEKGRAFAAGHLRWDDRAEILENLLIDIFDNG